MSCVHELLHVYMCPNTSVASPHMPSKLFPSLSFLGAGAGISLIFLLHAVVECRVPPNPGTQSAHVFQSIVLNRRNAQADPKFHNPDIPCVSVCVCASVCLSVCSYIFNTGLYILQIYCTCAFQLVKLIVARYVLFYLILL